MTSMVVAASSAVVGSVLDTLPVMDRVFHDLAYEVPLVEQLVARVRSVRSSGRVLIVGPNALLPDVLSSLGYQVEIWRYPQTILTDSGVDMVGRTGSLDSLLVDPATERFDVILLPYILEAAREHPCELLPRLRAWLSPTGVVIAAYRAAGSLHHRLAAIAGSSAAAHGSSADGRAAAYGWPPFQARRLFGAEDLHAWGMQAGFRVEDQRRVMDRRAFVAIHALSVHAWLKAKVSHGVKRLVPSIRDCVVATLTPYADEERVDVQTREPFVSVIVAASDARRVGQALARIAEQTYPADRIEVVVVGHRLDGFETPHRLNVRHVLSEQPYGPRAANAALRAAKGEIVAFTDDHCAVSSDWVDVGVGALAEWTAAATGGVQADAGSALPFLVLPGARPTTPSDAWFAAANSFYVRAAAVNAGGFDESFEDQGGTSVGWDQELARRLESRGYRTRVEPALLVRRLFTYPVSRGWMREEFRRASTLATAVTARPRLVTPRWGLFAAPGTLMFDAAIAGLVLGLLAGPLPFVLVLPWLLENRRFVPLWPPQRARTAARNVRGIVLRHVIWLAGLLVGSARARRLVL